MIRPQAALWHMRLEQAWGVWSQQRARILAYHSVSRERTDQWAIHPRQLAAHMHWLRQHNYDVVSLGELLRQLEANEVKRRVVAITFDDGYVDFGSEALPILEHYAIPATLFVPTALVGGSSQWSSTPPAPLLNTQQLEQVVARGVELGSHSQTHPRLPDVSSDVLQAELTQSQAWLQTRWGLQHLVLAYPFGAAGAREWQAAQAAGYRAACGFGGHWGNSSTTPRFALTREPVTRSWDTALLQAHLRGWQDWRAVIRQRRRPCNPHSAIQKDTTHAPTLF